MIPIHHHTVTSSLLALPAAVALTRKLLHDRKTLVRAEPGSSAGRMNQVKRRAKTLTETLNNIVGYDHYGIND